MTFEEKVIVEEMRHLIDGLNKLFEDAAIYHIKFDCQFDDSQSFGEGKVAHLTIRAYKEI